MGKVLRTVLFGAAMFGLGYFVGKPGKGDTDTYKVMEKGDQTYLYDTQADSKLELARIDGKTFFADPMYNFEGFVKTSVNKELSENYSKKEEKNLLKDMKKKADDTIDKVFDKF